MERVVSTRQSMPNQMSKKKKKNRFAKFNYIMRNIFICIAVFGFFFVLWEGNDEIWFKAAVFNFSLFIIGFSGALYFNNPRRARYNIRRAIYITIVAIYTFFSEIYYKHKLKSYIRYNHGMGASYKEIYEFLEEAAQFYEPMERK